MCAKSRFLCQEEHLGLPAEVCAGLADEIVRERRLLILEIETEKRCNLRCPYCRESSWQSGGAEDLSLEEWTGVIDQGLDLGVRHILIKGRGEPLCQENTMPLIRSIRERGCGVELLTNGSQISRPLADELYRLGVHVVIKWDSQTEEVQDHLAGQAGAHRGIFEGRKNLLAAGYPVAGRQLGIKASVTKHNIEEIPALWRWARQRGIVPFVWRSLNNRTIAPASDWAVSLGQAKKLIEDISRIDAEEFHIHRQPHASRTGQHCDRLLYALAVRADGVVTPCSRLELPVGQVRQTSLRQIVRDSQVINDLRDIRAKIKGYCRICERASECHGCRASAYFHTGDYLASDPDCWHRRIVDSDEPRFEVKAKIPQKDAMSLIHGLAFKDKKKVLLSLAVSSDNIFVAPDKAIAPPALIEMLAQLCASNNAFKDEGNKKGQLHGYLAGIDNVRFSERVYAGDQLDLIIWNLIEFNELHRVQGEVFRGESLVAQAELTLREVDEWKDPPVGMDPQEKKTPVLRTGRYGFQADAKDKVGRGILNSLIQIDIKRAESVAATICFQPDFIGFKGHFPGYPVLPGVVILYLGWILAEMCSYHQLDLISIGRAKFKKPLHPWDEVKVELRSLPGEKDQLNWFYIEIMCAGDLAAKYEIGTKTI